MTDPRRTAELWRDIALKEEGIELYLARIERNMETHDDGIDPRTIGFDAAVEFAPDPCATSSPMFHGRKARLLTRVGLLSKAYTEHYVYTYDALIRSMLAKPEPAYRRFSCVTPSWDNSPRRRSGATIFHAADPAKFESWLSTILIQTTSRFAGDERLVFINAWNEWAEGNHLEPDLKHERAYLESTLRATRAVLRCRSDSTTELLVRAKATANPAD